MTGPSLATIPSSTSNETIIERIDYEPSPTISKTVDNTDPDQFTIEEERKSEEQPMSEDTSFFINDVDK